MTQNTRMGEKRATIQNENVTVRVMTQRSDLAARQREMQLKQDIVSHVKKDQ